MNKAKPSSAPWFYIAIAMGLGMLLSSKPVPFIALLAFLLAVSVTLRNIDLLILALFACIGFLRGIPYQKLQVTLKELDNKTISGNFRLFNESILKLSGTPLELKTSMPGFKQGTLLEVKGIYKSNINTLLPIYVEFIEDSKNLFDKIHNRLNFYHMQAFGLYEEGVLIKALLTGDRKGMSKETVENFRKAGVAHLLAISGLHLGFLFLLFNTLFMFIFRNDTISKIFASLFGGLYTFSLGPLAPCLRAFWFLLLLNLSSIIGRKVRALNIWGIAFSLSIFFKPQWLKDPSFLMSYFAILGFLSLSEIFSVKIPKGKWTYNIENYLVSVLVPLLFTLPLQVMFFGKVSLACIFSNLFLIPVTFLIIFESFFTLFFLATGLPLWIPFRNCAFILSRFMLDSSHRLSNLPGNSLNVHNPASLLVFSILYIILILYILVRVKGKGA